MTKLPVRRIGAIIVMLTFVIGLPMQGFAVASVAMVTPVSWSADADLQTPDTCDGCVEQPVGGMSCPIVFCVGLSAIVSEEPESGLFRSHDLSTEFRDTRAGPPVPPDPYPPRS